MPLPDQHYWLGEPPRRRFSSRLAVIGMPILALVLLLSTIAMGMVYFNGVEAHGLSVLPGTLSPLLKQSKIREHANQDQRISLAIGLRPRNQEQMRDFTRDMLRPRSIDGRRYLTREQFSNGFSPDSKDYDALLQFLRLGGFTITHTYSHRLLIAFSGTVGQVERAFHVTINTYSEPGGKTFYANTQDPQLPVQFSDKILSISGMNNAAHWRHSPIRSRSIPDKHKEAASAIHSPAAAMVSEASAVTCPSHSKDHLTPDQVAAAYGLQDLHKAGYQGKDQTIALFELNDFLMSDLTTYTTCFTHNPTTIQTVKTGSGPVGRDEGMIEVEMDAELILSAVPQLNTLKIYEAANNTADILAEWAQIVQDATPVVSTSWGICEAQVDPGLLQQENTLFTAAALQGQSIFAASGDSGAAGCYFDRPSTQIAQLSAGDPGSQPFVTGVGGTSLTVGDGTAYGSEVAWNNPSTSMLLGGASGGGISRYWTAPDWQDAPGVHNTYSTGATCNAPEGKICREAPDVALHADPNAGYVVYCTAPEAGCERGHAWLTAGGTSAGAPIWAAFAALANEMSLRQGGFHLGFFNPLLYELARDPAKYADSFHDVTVGSNDFNHLTNGNYPATPGYDMATGLGSYKASALAANLVALAKQKSGQRATPSASTWYFASGRVGGGDAETLLLRNPSTSQDATVSIDYYYPNKNPVSIRHTVSQNSRTEINVNTDLHISTSDHRQPVSAIVQVLDNGPRIVAEQRLSVNYLSLKLSSAQSGGTGLSTAFYFPKPDAPQVEDISISILNPSPQNSATVTLTSHTNTCGQDGQVACPSKRLIVQPLRNSIVSQLSQQAAIELQADQQIAAERLLYRLEKTAG